MIVLESMESELVGTGDGDGGIKRRDGGVVAGLAQRRGSVGA